MYEVVSRRFEGLGGRASALGHALVRLPARIMQLVVPLVYIRGAEVIINRLSTKDLGPDTVSDLYEPRAFWTKARPATIIQSPYCPWDCGASTGVVFRH